MQTTDIERLFYCEKCGSTFCFEDTKVPSINLPSGFRPHAVNFVLKGLCPGCGGADAD